MNNISWIKITTDIFNDEKILLIESMTDDYDTVIVIWLKLLALAEELNNDGVLIANGKPYNADTLAKKFNRKQDTVKSALDIFSQLGMIEITNNVITIPLWGEYQIKANSTQFGGR